MPALQVGMHILQDMPVRTSALRGLGALVNVWAIESVMDELAAAVGEDPLSHRLRHLDDARARDVLNAAARMAGWERRVKTEGRAFGLGVSRYKGSGAWCAAVAEIEAAERILCRRLWLACDVGEAINPDGIANMGGSLAFNRSDNFQTNLPWIRQAYEKAKANPELLIYKLKSNSYKWSWAIIPLSVPFLWLMFPFSRRFRAYDHVVFVTYSIAFVTLLVSIGTIFAYFGVTAVAPLILLIIPVHMYRQLRGAYSLGRWGAVWRTWGLLFAALIVLIIFILSMGALGLME
jgi:hypothetical protein